MSNDTKRWQDMTLDETVDRIMAIIEAEHSRVSPRVVHL